VRKGPAARLLCGKARLLEGGEVVALL